MAAPAMLDRDRPTLVDHRRRPDPLVSLSVLLLILVAVGLLIAAVAATVGYSVPDFEAPLAEWIAIVFGATLLLNVGVLARRYVRRRSRAA